MERRVAFITLCVVLVTSSFHVKSVFAARRVSIKIVARPKNEEELKGPQPFRPAALPSGPFSDMLETLQCVQNKNVKIYGQEALLDACMLKNVTHVVSDSENPEAEPVRKITGMFKGWVLDPVTFKYKYMLFDDGDVCKDGKRFAIALEVVPCTKCNTLQLYAFDTVDECTFRAKVSGLIEPHHLDASKGMLAPGVIELADPTESLPKVCGEMKCKYDAVSAKVKYVLQEIKKIQQSVEDLTSSAPESNALSQVTLLSAKDIMKTSSSVMEKTLELLESVEKLQHPIPALWQQDENELTLEEAGSEMLAELETSST